MKWLRKRAAHLVNFPESGSERDMIKIYEVETDDTCR